MNVHFYSLTLGILAVWRATHLLNAEDGPWNLVFRLRRLAGTGFWAELLDCFYCLSLWIAAPLAYWVGGNLKEQLLLWPALSAGAILLERIAPEKTRVTEFCTEDQYSEDEEKTHVLWQEPTATSSEASLPSGTFVSAGT